VAGTGLFRSFSMAVDLFLLLFVVVIIAAAISTNNYLLLNFQSI